MGIFRIVFRDFVNLQPEAQTSYSIIVQLPTLYPYTLRLKSKSRPVKGPSGSERKCVGGEGLEG